MRWFHPIVWPLLIAVISFLAADLSKDKSIRAKSIGYYYDPTGQESIESVRRKPFHESTTTVSPETKNIWVKIDVPPATYLWAGDAILFTGSNEPVLGMSAYLVRPSKVENLGYCDVSLDEDNCKIPSLQYAFPIRQLNPSDAATIFIKMNPGPMGINHEFYFMHNTYFNRMTIFLDFFIGLCSGISLLVLVLSVIFFYTLKESGFLAYSLFYLNMCAYILIRTGIWDIFKPDFITFSGAQLIFPVSIFTVFFDLLFIKIFFDFSQKNRFLNKIYTLFFMIIVIEAFLGFVPSTQSLAWKLFGPSVFLSMLLIAGTLIYFVRQGRKWSESTASAWGVAIACNLIWSSYHEGLIQGFWFFGYLPILGRALEALLLNSIIFQKLRDMNIKLGFVRAKNDENQIVKTLLRTLSHDLSNITQLILTSAEIMGKNKNPELLQKNISYILDAAKSQAEIIENAKKNYLNRGGLIISLAPVDLKQCLGEVLEGFHSRLQRKNLKLNVSVPEKDIAVFAEKTTLCYQVLANLMSNAFKFTPSGGHISVNIMEIDETWIELKINDDGIGISGPILERLFDEHESISRPGTNGEPGTGHGLIIVKDFVQAYGGHLQLESTAGKGTIVVIRLKKYG